MYFDYNEIYEEKLMPIIVQLKSVCNMNKIPFFLAVCTKNDEEKTDYRCNMFSAVSNDIALHNDNIVKFVDVLNGFDVIPNSEVLSEDYNSSKIDTNFENLPSTDPLEELISGLRNSIMNLSHAKEMITDMKNERDGIAKKPKSRRGRPKKNANKETLSKNDNVINDVDNNADDKFLTTEDTLSRDVITDDGVTEIPFMPEPVDDFDNESNLQQIELFSEDDVVEMQIQSSKKIAERQDNDKKPEKKRRGRKPKAAQDKPDANTEDIGNIADTKGAKDTKETKRTKKNTKDNK